MTDYKKYKSIVNHYQTKAINDVFQYIPEYMTCQYVAEEKIDGANIRLSFEYKGGTDVEFKFGKRTAWLEPSEKFYDYQSVLNDPRMKEFIGGINHLMQFVENVGDTFVFHGELAGQGVQNRIKYFDNKQIRFFGCEFNGEVFTQRDFYEFMDDVKFDDLYVPIVGLYNSFDEAMAIDVESLPSFYNNDETVEGVVIKPFSKLAINTQGEQQLFYIKKKSIKFQEKMKCKRIRREKVADPMLDEAIDTFSEYLNENRMLSVFSKEGEIDKPEQMGKYIKLFMEDAKIDYLSENTDKFMALDDKQRSKVFKIAGKMGSKILQKYL